MIDPATESIDAKLARKREEYNAKVRENARKKYHKNKKRVLESHKKYETREDRKQRTCLTCDKKFSSASKANRICYSCKQTCDYISANEEYEIGR